MKKASLSALVVLGLVATSVYLSNRGLSKTRHTTYGRLPIVFEENQGQSQPEVRMLARVGNTTIFLKSDGLVMRVRNVRRSSTVKMEFVGGNRNAEVQGQSLMASRSSYFIGHDRQAWRTDVANYAKVRYKEIYPGVDLFFYGEEGTLEYDFRLSAGADPGAIRMRFPGVEKVELTPEGDLTLESGETKIVQRRPAAYQEGKHGRTEVASRYVLQADGEARIEIGEYNRGKGLVIDPVVTYSTYLGGNGDDAATAIAVDNQGAAYVTGQTASTDFPVVGGPNCGTTCAGGFGDVFVTKISPDGKSIVYSTYLGGSGLDIGRAIAVDADGNAYVTGMTSGNFPTTQGAFQTACMSHACQTAFVTKLNPVGNQLVYSTYLGGSSPSEEGHGIAVDGSQHAYVTGITSSNDFPTTAGAYATQCGTHGECSSFIGDAFVSKISVDGSSLDYSTFLGGGSGDAGNAIAVDSTGRAYVAGRTFSTDFPTTSGAPQTKFGGGNTDGFVARLTADGSKLDYSTYLGGSGDDLVNGVAVDGNSNTYVTGTTSSEDFPIVAGSFQTNSTGLPDAFVTEITPMGNGLVYSTYLGGELNDTGDSIVVSPNGNAFVAGSTSSAHFPTASPTQATCAPCPLSAIGYVAKLTGDGSKQIFSTYLGGSFQDAAKGIAIDGNGDAYVAGLADSSDFPTTPGSVQETRSTPGDAFVAKISGLMLPAVTLPVSFVNFPNQQLVGTTSSQPPLTLKNVGDAPLSISGITASTNFGVSDDCNGSVAGLGSCSITISFTPTAVGQLGGGVTITDNAADSPQSIAMSGVGVDFSLSVASGGSSSASVVAGGTGKYNLQALPAGLSGQVALSCSGAPPQGGCSITPSSVNLDGTNPASFEVDVPTMARNGALSGMRLDVPDKNRWLAPAEILVSLLAVLLLCSFGLAAAQPQLARPLIAWAVFVMFCMGVIAGCGGSSSSQPTGTPAGTYNLTVKGTAAGGSRNMGLTLTVN